MDPNKFTQKTQEAIKNAAELAQDNSNAQISPVHLAISLFEDPEGLAKQAVMREGSDETLRSILRVLRKKLVRLPAVDPPPEQVRKDFQQSCKGGDLDGLSFYSPTERKGPASHRSQSTSPSACPHSLPMKLG